MLLYAATKGRVPLINVCHLAGKLQGCTDSHTHIHTYRHTHPCRLHVCRAIIMSANLVCMCRCVCVWVPVCVFECVCVCLCVNVYVLLSPPQTSKGQSHRPPFHALSTELSLCPSLSLPHSRLPSLSRRHALPVSLTLPAQQVCLINAL